MSDVGHGTGPRKLTARGTASHYKRIIRDNLWRIDLCAIVCKCGPNGEPLACGYKRGHHGDHSWATLPTFPARDK